MRPITPSWRKRQSEGQGESKRKSFRVVLRSFVEALQATPYGGRLLVFFTSWKTLVNSSPLIGQLLSGFKAPRSPHWSLVLLAEQSKVCTFYVEDLFIFPQPSSFHVPAEKKTWALVLGICITSFSNTKETRRVRSVECRPLADNLWTLLAS